jgi:hypothetical protein
MKSGEAIWLVAEKRPHWIASSPQHTFNASFIAMAKYC